MNAKEGEKQNEINKKTFPYQHTVEYFELDGGGGQFANMGMIGRMASVYYFLLLVYMWDRTLSRSLLTFSRSLFLDPPTGLFSLESLYI